jgi:hypothetical protein
MSNEIKLPELGEMTLHMWQDCLVHYNNELTKRANRIAKLEAALRLYACESTCPNCYGQVQDTRYCGWTARKALEGKDD